MMRILYMGTPDFAVPALTRLHEAGHEILLVVTQPDRARDRGKKVLATPVKEEALRLGLPVAQPEKVKGNSEFIRQVSALSPDVIAVAAYGQVLPKEILEIPPLGCINIHGSLLPKYRGAAPIQRSIMNGDDVTGVTLMYMAEGLDTGDMIVKETVEIGSKDAGQLHDELSVIGADLLVKTLPDIENQKAPRTPQKEEEASYAAMLTKQDGLLDFSESPERVFRRMKGVSPWPGAFTYLEGQQMKVKDGKPGDALTEHPPGTVLDAGKEGLTVACGGGKVFVITHLQMPGKKALPVKDYLVGNKIEIYTHLG